MSFTPNIQVIRERNGATVDVSRFGQLITGLRHDDILCRFEYNNSDFDVTTAVTGTGASSNANSLAVASSGASTGSCTFTTLRSLTYRPAHEMYIFVSAVFSGASVGATARLGGYDDNNGFYFGYVDTTFGIGIRKGAADTFVARTSWNKDKCDGTGGSGFNLDPTKNNQYKITYGWLGVAPITYSVYGGESRGWVVCHVLDYTNIQTTPSVYSPNNSIRWSASRTSGSGATTVAVGCAAGGSTEGVHSHAGHRVFAGRASATLVGTVLTPIATFRSKSTFQGKSNKIRAEAVLMGLSTDGNKPVEFFLYSNSSLAGGTWTDVNTNNSVIEYSLNTVPTAGNFEMSIPMGKSEGTLIDLGAGHVHLEVFPGGTMSISALSSSSSDVAISFRWEEYFA